MPLFNIQLGEVVFGGVGAGLYGMLVMAVLAVFIAGLMVGRTPEYLGKKIETREVKYAMLYALVFPLVILVFTAWAAVAPYGLSSLNNAGPHGLSEILYAFTSGAGNNGSAFAGISANTPWYNTTLGLDMLFGRFWMILPALALAGSLAGKKVGAARAGHAAHQRSAVRGPARGRHPHRGRAHLLPRPLAWAPWSSTSRPGRKGVLSHDASAAASRSSTARSSARPSRTA